MSEPRDEPAAEPKAEVAGPSETDTPAPPAAAGQWRGVAPRLRLALGLTALLLLLVVLVGTALFWANSLPWTLPREPELGPRVERLEAGQQQSRQQRQQDAAGGDAARQRVEQRLGALEARPAAAAGDIAELRQQLATVSANAAELAARLGAMDKAVRRQASDSTDTAMVLVLLQIRDAVALARPFAAEYEALLALARAVPEIAAAAAPLAEPAKSGVAGRAALAARLHELRAAIAALEAASTHPESAAPASNWTDQALDRLRRLVQIRRIDGAGAGTSSGLPAAAVDVAARALAGGDLDAAVAALDKLTGAPAEAADPWLRMARQRLAVEAALRRVEALLAARLGAAANAAAASGSAQ